MMVAEQERVLSYVHRRRFSLRHEVQVFCDCSHFLINLTSHSLLSRSLLILYSRNSSEPRKEEFTNFSIQYT
jgi:hypothetical protein